MSDSPWSSVRRTGADPAPVLEAGLRALDAALLPCAATLLSYLVELEKWNGAYNLTAVRDPAEMVTRHLLDSLAVLPYVGEDLLDVGSGAGLPALPLAIVKPALRVSALDSNGKKTRFMRHAVRTLALSNVEVVESRVEQYRPAQAYAQIVSRAYATLADFVSQTRHLLAPGGQWLAMKGKLDDQERQNLPPGVVVVDVISLKVPGLSEARHLIVMGEAGA